MSDGFQQRFQKASGSPVSISASFACFAYQGTKERAARERRTPSMYSSSEIFLRNGLDRFTIERASA